MRYIWDFHGNCSNRLMTKHADHVNRICDNKKLYRQNTHMLRAIERTVDAQFATIPLTPSMLHGILEQFHFTVASIRLRATTFHTRINPQMIHAELTTKLASIFVARRQSRWISQTGFWWSWLLPIKKTTSNLDIASSILMADDKSI